MSYAHKYFDEVEVTSRLLNIILDMPVDQQLKLLYSLDKSGCKGSRRHTRANLKKPWIVQVDPEKEKQSGNFFINDISRCGMFIETSSSFFVGQNIAVKFQMPVSKKIFQMIGEIVRLQDNGIGIKFKRQL
jgi:hypothetical protein